MLTRKFIRLINIMIIISCVVSTFFATSQLLAQEFGGVSSSDAVKFRGTWEGEIEVAGRDAKINIQIKISDTEVSQYFYSKKKNDWRLVNPDIIKFTCVKNNAVLYWHNHSTVWSENQVFSLSFVNSGELNLVWLRHVNNVRKDEDNESWHLSGNGKLYIK